VKCRPLRSSRSSPSKTCAACPRCPSPKPWRVCPAGPRSRRADRPAPSTSAASAKTQCPPPPAGREQVATSRDRTIEYDRYRPSWSIGAGVQVAESVADRGRRARQGPAAHRSPAGRNCYGAETQRSWQHCDRAEQSADADVCGYWISGF
jgi:hypothetical protein